MITALIIFSCVSIVTWLLSRMTQATLRGEKVANLGWLAFDDDQPSAPGAAKPATVKLDANGHILTEAAPPGNSTAANTPRRGAAWAAPAQRQGPRSPTGGGGHA